MPSPLPNRLPNSVLAYVEPVSIWKHELKVKHLFTTQEDAFSVGSSMIRIGEALEGSGLFVEFKGLARFFEEDDIEVANVLLDDLYDYCDAHGIWLA